MNSTTLRVLICTSMIIGCKKDDPVGPDTTPILPASVTAIIGTSGGTLTTNGFSLTVPAAAFAAAETLTVVGVTYDNAFGSRVLTGAYKLEGLPVSFTKALEVSIACNRTPNGAFSIFQGREGTAQASGESLIFYRPIAATKDSIFLKGTILPDPTGGAGGSLRKGMKGSGLTASVKWFLGVDQVTSKLSASGNFRILYPGYAESVAGTLAAALENAYTGFSQMGFDAAMYTDVRWPLDVVISKIHIPAPSPSAELVAFEVRGGDYPPDMGMVFDEDASVAADVPTIQKAAAQTFCNLFFTANDRFFWHYRDAQAIRVERHRIWPYYAIGAWAAEFYAPVGSGGNAPINFRPLQMCPFDGLTVASGETPSAHGLSLSPIMQYIKDAYGPSSVIQLYYKIPGVEFAIDAIKAALPVPEQEWWPGFLKEYIQGKLYAVTSNDLLKDLSSPSSPGVFTVQAKTDTLKKFSDRFADLSAKLYRVNLRFAGLDTSSLIRFSAGPASLGSQYVGVMLFGLKDNTLTYWQYANTVTVKQVKDLTASGYDIVAAVVNCLNVSPYLGMRTIELTVTVESAIISPKVAQFRTKLRGTETGSSVTGPGSLWYSSGFKNGTMSAGKFKATWNQTSPDYPSGTVTVTGDMMIQLDGVAPPARVVGFSVKETILHSAYNNEVWEVTSSGTCSINAYWEYNRYVHRITGLTAHDQAATTVNRYDSFGDGYWRSFSNPSGDAEDYIEIIIE